MPIRINSCYLKLVLSKIFRLELRVRVQVSQLDHMMRDFHTRNCVSTEKLLSIFEFKSKYLNSDNFKRLLLIQALALSTKEICSVFSS